MASVVQLYTAVSSALDADGGELRYVARVLQQGGILPIGKRGGGKNTPQVTAKHCAMFLFGMAAGTRRARSAAEDAQRFAKLVTHGPDESTLTLLDAVVGLINVQRGGPAILDEGQPVRILFIHNKTWPRVEIPVAEITGAEDGIPPESPNIFVPDVPEDERPSDSFPLCEFVGATMFDSGIFQIFADLLGPIEE